MSASRPLPREEVGVLMVLADAPGSREFTRDLGLNRRIRLLEEMIKQLDPCAYFGPTMPSATERAKYSLVVVYTDLSHTPKAHGEDYPDIPLEESYKNFNAALGDLPIEVPVVVLSIARPGVKMLAQLGGCTAPAEKQQVDFVTKAPFSVKTDVGRWLFGPGVHLARIGNWGKSGLHQAQLQSLVAVALASAVELVLDLLPHHGNDSALKNAHLQQVRSETGLARHARHEHEISNMMIKHGSIGRASLEESLAAEGLKFDDSKGYDFEGRETLLHSQYDGSQSLEAHITSTHTALRPDAHGGAARKQSTVLIADKSTTLHIWAAEQDSRVSLRDGEIDYHSFIACINFQDGIVRALGLGLGAASTHQVSAKRGLFRLKFPKVDASEWLSRQRGNGGRGKRGAKAVPGAVMRVGLFQVKLDFDRTGPVFSTASSSSCAATTGYDAEAFRLVAPDLATVQRASRTRFTDTQQEFLRAELGNALQLSHPPANTARLKQIAKRYNAAVKGFTQPDITAQQVSSFMSGQRTKGPKLGEGKRRRGSNLVDVPDHTTPAVPSVGGSGPSAAQAILDSLSLTLSTTVDDLETSLDGLAIAVASASDKGVKS